jgi:hypothetical protein
MWPTLVRMACNGIFVQFWTGSSKCYNIGSIVYWSIFMSVVYDVHSLGRLWGSILDVRCVFLIPYLDSAAGLTNMKAVACFAS